MSNVNGIASDGVGQGDMRTDDREQRLTRLSAAAYVLIFDRGTPRSVARGLGLLLFVAAQRERDSKQTVRQ